MIRLLRVDDSFLYGKKALLWINATRAKVIVLIDNGLRFDYFAQSLLNMACPSQAELVFLDVEEAVIRDLDCTRTVIAPGGSAICREEAARHLKELGLVVYLHVPLEELERRIRNITTRGIAMSPGQTLADVYAAREPLYRKYADLTVDVTGGNTLEQTVAAVVARLG